MRSLTTKLVVALSLVAAQAMATNDAPVGKGKEGPSGAGGGPTGGGGVTGGQNASNQGDSASASNPDDGSWGGLLDLRRGIPAGRKYWEVGGAWESHALLTQTDLEGAGSQRYFHYFYLYAFADLTARNRISVRGGAYERFLADQGESGWRLSDVSISYTRRIDLPWELELRLRGTITLPTSYSSQKITGQISAPTLTLLLDRKFGKYLSVDLRVFGTYYWNQYTTAAGGNPNSIVSFGGLLSAEFEMPFHPALSVGGELYTEYYLFYDANGATQYGTVTDSQFPTQPLQQIYGGELFARYTFPHFYGVKADLSVAYAQGDPSMGYTSINHDGLAHVYPYWRLNSEVYGVLTLAY